MIPKFMEKANHKGVRKPNKKLKFYTMCREVSKKIELVKKIVFKRMTRESTK